MKRPNLDVRTRAFVTRVVFEGGRAELRWVSLGEAIGDAVPIRAGVRLGEVVVDAPGTLRDGQAVAVEGSP